MQFDWGNYVPLVDPNGLQIITVVCLSDFSAPEPWILADVENERITRIGHPRAKDVAVFERGLLNRDTISVK